MLDPPGVFTYRDGVAVIQIFFFSIYLIFGFIICFRHGFRRSEGWYILITFSILRILGGVFQLISINTPTRAIYTGALICEGVGLAPLTLINLGIFGRVTNAVNSSHRRIFSLITVAVLVGIALNIDGGRRSARSTDLATNNLLKISVIIFLASYLAFVFLFLIFLQHWHSMPLGEQKLLICFALCMPFMAVRFVYSILGNFVPSLRSEFSVLTGNVTIYLVMAVIEEIIVVAIFVFTGMNLDRLPSASGPGARSRGAPVVVQLRSRRKSRRHSRRRSRRR